LQKGCSIWQPCFRLSAIDDAIYSIIVKKIFFVKRKTGYKKEILHRLLVLSGKKKRKFMANLFLCIAFSFLFLFLFFFVRSGVVYPPSKKF